jgi:hypothetical protein
MTEEVNAGGLWCSEVLAKLSEYVDKELPPPRQHRLKLTWRNAIVASVLVTASPPSLGN